MLNKRMQSGIFGINLLLLLYRNINRLRLIVKGIHFLRLTITTSYSREESASASTDGKGLMSTLMNGGYTFILA